MLTAACISHVGLGGTGYHTSQGRRQRAWVGPAPGRMWAGEGCLAAALPELGRRWGGLCLSWDGAGGLRAPAPAEGLPVELGPQWQPQARTTMLRCLRRMTLLLLS